MVEPDTQERIQVWSDWLRAQLAEHGWSQSDLANKSGGLIKRDRVSRWVNAHEGPSHRLAVVTANLLQVPPAEALAAAGFSTESRPEPMPPLRDLSAYTSEELARELLKRLNDAPVLVGGYDDDDYSEDTLRKVEHALVARQTPKTRLDPDTP